MIKANTIIRVGSRVYRAGQTVTGLSKTDREWMGKAGYITEIAAGKKEDPSEIPAKEEM